MYNSYHPYQRSQNGNPPLHNPYNNYPYPQPYNINNSYYNPYSNDRFNKSIDYGSKPYAVNIKEITKQNNNFRTALWTGNYLQLTLMSIDASDDIGLEVHYDHDQFIRIEEGQGILRMGDEKDRLDYQKEVYEGYGLFIPAGKWHNLVNTGSLPIKLYSIYAPPEHPYGTVHKTKQAAKNQDR